MAQQYLPYHVYKIIPEFLKYRKLTFDGETLRPTAKDFGDRDTIIPLIMRFGYYRIDAKLQTSEVQDLVVIYILPAESKYSHHSGDLRGLISSLDSDKKIVPHVDKNRLYEVIIIVDESMLIKKNLTDVVLEFRGKNQPPFYNMYPFPIFSVVIPKVVGVQPHRIITREEADAYMKREYIISQDLNTISTSDPPVVWLGAHPGDFIEIERLSETAGKAITVRIVTPGKII
jgi:DNA-directed RNA polymerase subunit H (RpoH/RPB5)